MLETNPESEGYRDGVPGSQLVQHHGIVLAHGSQTVQEGDELLEHLKEWENRVGRADGDKEREDHEDSSERGAHVVWGSPRLIPVP